MQGSNFSKVSRGANDANSLPAVNWKKRVSLCETCIHGNHRTTAMYHQGRTFGRAVCGITDHFSDYPSLFLDAQFPILRHPSHHNHHGHQTSCSPRLAQTNIFQVREAAARGTRRQVLSCGAELAHQIAGRPVLATTCS